MVITLLCVAAAHVWMPPIFSLAVGDLANLVGLVLFVGIGGVISGLNEASRGASGAPARAAEHFRVRLASSATA
jgi:hypothetical protein